MNRKPVAGILLGSDPDYETMIEAAKALDQFMMLPVPATAALRKGLPMISGRFDGPAAFFRLLLTVV